MTDNSGETRGLSHIQNQSRPAVDAVGESPRVMCRPESTTGTLTHIFIQYTQPGWVYKFECCHWAKTYFNEKEP